MAKILRYKGKLYKEVTARSFSDKVPLPTAEDAIQNIRNIVNGAFDEYIGQDIYFGIQGHAGKAIKEILANIALESLQTSLKEGAFENVDRSLTSEIINSSELKSFAKECANIYFSAHLG